jgi:hypothetical protein
MSASKISEATHAQRIRCIAAPAGLRWPIWRKRGRLGRRARPALARLAVCRSVTIVGLSSNGRMISGEGAASQIAEQVLRARRAKH